MKTEVDNIASLLERTFEKQPWYGSSVMEILKDVTPEVANLRIGNTHTIAELVEHMIAWRTFATRRLMGDGDFEITEDTNFPKPANEWHQLVESLRKNQGELLNAVKRFPVDRLTEIVPSREHKYNYYTLLHGIIQHDIYHLGQIALIRKGGKE